MKVEYDILLSERESLFFVHIMRRKALENSVITGKFSVKEAEEDRENRC